MRMPETPELRVFVFAAGIVGDIQTRNADVAAGARDRHHRIQHRGGRFIAASRRGPRFESHAIDRAIHFRHAQHLSNLIAELAPS